MKIRIKSDFVRFRLTKTEVKTLAETGYLEEHTHFPESVFTYAVQGTSGINILSASFVNNKITLLVPISFTKTWPDNDIVGRETEIKTVTGKTLLLLLEKDFVCLDETTEDQSDNYENPNKQV